MTEATTVSIRWADRGDPDGITTFVGVTNVIVDKGVLVISQATTNTMIPLDRIRSAVTELHND